MENNIIKAIYVAQKGMKRKMCFENAFNYIEGPNLN